VTATNDREERGGLPPHPTLTDYYRRDEDRPEFVRHLFDEAAPSYDRVERLIGFGAGGWYRRQALSRSGLVPGMRVLDVAVGTGLVAREALGVLGGDGLLVGLDPSAGMLRQACRHIALSGVLGVGEGIPVRDGSFDFLSMGYALRHLSDLHVTFREFHRVLRPGGAVCLLELTRPTGRVACTVLRSYLHVVVPFLTRIVSRSRETALLMRYYWDTVEQCVPPGDILSALEAAGFVNVRRTLVIGLFSEYTGIRAGAGIAAAPVRAGGNFFERVMER
jgi:demethylmenaquinone methyltransferase/2-methoxy-6-polyprenyl-1,4-benzoquinol methylase